MSTELVTTAIIRYTPNTAATPEQLAANQAKLDEMVAAGKTSGNRYVCFTSYPPEPVEGAPAIRAFVTLADAQEYGTFASGIGATNITYFNQV
jgi:hypothetical protein